MARDQASPAPSADDDDPFALELTQPPSMRRSGVRGLEVGSWVVAAMLLAGTIAAPLLTPSTGSNHVRPTPDPSPPGCVPGQVLPAPSSAASSSASQVPQGATSSVAPSTAQDPLRYRWTRLRWGDLQGPPLNGNGPILRHGAGFLTVGDGRWLATSTDGRRWDQVPLEGAPDEYVSDVARSCTGYLAIGADGFETWMWISPDGVTWTPLSIDPAMERFGFGNSIEAWPGGFVTTGCFGRRLDDSVRGLCDGPIMLATSADGRTWQTFPTDLEEPEFRPVALGADLLLFASTGDGVRLYRTTHGASWTTAESALGSLDAVVETSDGLLALGVQRADRSGAPTGLLTSIDGVAWKAIELPVDRPIWALTTIAVLPTDEAMGWSSDLVVVSGIVDRGRRAQGMVWIRSGDGPWRRSRLPARPGHYGYASASGISEGGRILLFGSETNPSEVEPLNRPRVWIGVPGAS
jgi:hypothetical protein